ncbi:MAG: D-glycero-alpha-D-manno-heptose-1,7-bisphosphate 7-phosphatase [Omnitrophica WOR_2 bacterium]
MYNRPMQPAVFLDRDGVIIENREDYVRAWSDVAIYPQALRALARLQSKPYKIVIVTNQSVIGRGIITPSEAEAINQRLVKEIVRAGGRVDGLFVCPHAPQENCACRKPKPGLFIQAARRLDIDLSQSILIGDSLSDLSAGQAAGVRQTALVLTGHGAVQSRSPEAALLRPFLTFDTLEDALRELVP